ncbi:MAG: DUF1549 domain-containing protein [Planctomycetota bacterium]
MNSDQSDSLLEALLAEAVGQQQPPDLSAQILARWTGERSAAPAHFQEAASGEVVRQRVTKRARGSRAALLPWGLAVAMGLVGLLLIAWSGKRTSELQRSTQQTAAAVPAATSSGNRSAAVQPRPAPATNEPRSNTPANSRASSTTNARPPRPATAPQTSASQQTDSASNSSTSSSASNSKTKPNSDAHRQPPGSIESSENLAPSAASAVVQPRSTAPPKRRDEEVIAIINVGLKENWSRQGLEPSGRATDAEWCRRAMLRLLGRIPTTEEVARYVADRRSDKREQLVDQLLGGDAYEEEFVGYWAETWTRLLVGRTGGPSPEATRFREGLLQYLREALHARRPFPAVVTELIAATGSSSRESDDYQGAVNFLLAHHHDQSASAMTSATARVARLFLGVNLQCAQCHAHPTEPQWTQDRFWQLNSFFRQAVVERSGDQSWRLVNRDFVGEGRDVESAAVFYELPSGVVRAAYPVFLDGTELPTSGRVSEVDRRAELARLVTHSPDFSRAIINRLWAHFLGYGFVNPIDDLGPQRPVVMPAVWEQLAATWSAQGHDWRSALRWIALSDAFALSSRLPTKLASPARGGAGGSRLTDAPEAGTLPQFTRYYTRPMPIEELYRSLQVLAQARRAEGASAAVTSATRQAWLSQLARRVGPEAVDDDQAIISQMPQSLLRLSDEVTRQAFHGASDNVLERVVRNQALSADEKIEHLFQAALARKPTGRELAGAQQLLETTPADSSIALTDLWWALLNSNEFLLDH